MIRKQITLATRKLVLSIYMNDKIAIKSLF